MRGTPEAAERGEGLAAAATSRGGRRVGCGTPTRARAGSGLSSAARCGCRRAYAGARAGFAGWVLRRPRRVRVTVGRTGALGGYSVSVPGNVFERSRSLVREPRPRAALRVDVRAGIPGPRGRRRPRADPRPLAEAGARRAAWSPAAGPPPGTSPPARRRRPLSSPKRELSGQQELVSKFWRGPVKPAGVNF